MKFIGWRKKIVPKGAFYSTSQTFCGKQVDLMFRKADTINTKYQYRGKTVLLLMEELLWKSMGGIDMHAKTMEGLVGASTNMELMNTPFRVYKEARRKGDTATMERAMGYVGDCADKAEEYRQKAEDGMKEDAEEARAKEETERENAIQKRRDEREELEKKIEENRNEKTDTVEISEDGRAECDKYSESDQAGLQSDAPEKTAEDMINKPVIYTKTGEAGKAESCASISVSV